MAVVNLQSNQIIDLSPYFDESHKFSVLYYSKTPTFVPKQYEDQLIILNLLNEIEVDLQSYHDDDDDDDDDDWPLRIGGRYRYNLYDDDDDEMTEEIILDDIKKLNFFLKKAKVHFRFLEDIIDVLIKYLDDTAYSDEIIDNILTSIVQMCNNAQDKLLVAKKLFYSQSHDAIIKSAELYKDCSNDKMYIAIMDKNIKTADEYINFAKYFSDNDEIHHATFILERYLFEGTETNVDIYIALFKNLMLIGDDEKLINLFNEFQKFKKIDILILKQAKIIYNYLKQKPHFNVKRSLIQQIIKLCPDSEKNSWTEELKKVDYQEKAYKAEQKRAQLEAERRAEEERKHAAQIEEERRAREALAKEQESNTVESTSLDANSQNDACVKESESNVVAATSFDANSQSDACVKEPESNVIAATSLDTNSQSDACVKEPESNVIAATSLDANSQNEAQKTTEQTPVETDQIATLDSNASSIKKKALHNRFRQHSHKPKPKIFKQNIHKPTPKIVKSQPTKLKKIKTQRTLLEKRNPKLKKHLQQVQKKRVVKILRPQLLNATPVKKTKIKSEMQPRKHSKLLLKPKQQLTK